jgi:hypothetical protein
MLDSIGSLIDRLVIETIKVFLLREKVNNKNLSDEEVVKANDKMIIINNNRSLIVAALNEKLTNVKDGKEKNEILKAIKTYD